MVRELKPIEYSTLAGDYIPIAEKLIGKGMIPYVYDIHVSKAISAANTEFITGNTTDLSTALSGSYKTLDVKSDSTDDKSAASGDTRKVTFWAIDRYYDYRVEEVSMSGTTVVASSNSYRAVNSMWGSQYGTSADDAKGNIDIGATSDITDEVLRIAANTRVTTSARIWIPKNWRARIIGGNVAPVDADVGISSGLMVYPHYYDAYDCKEEDSTFDKINVHRDGMKFDETLWPRTYGNDNTISKLTFYGNRVKNSETWGLQVRLLLWATNKVHVQLGSSQSKYLQG